jgi:membrane protein required for colicin V production
VNGFDIALVVLASVLVLLGLLKGLIRILVGLTALIAAFVLASRYHGTLADALSGIDISREPLMLLSYLLIFLGVMLAGGLAAWMVRRLVKAAMLSWADRLAGAAVGLIVALLAAALIVLPVVAYSPFSESMLADSMLAPYVSMFADAANLIVPEDLSERYREKMDELRQYWQKRWNEHREPDPPEVVAWLTAAQRPGSGA